MPSLSVSARDIEQAARQLGLSDRPVEVHASVRSFGALADGPATIVDGLLDAGATVVAATMAPDLFGIPAPPDDRPSRNGLDYAAEDVRAAVEGQWPPAGVYDATRTEVPVWLGAFSAHVAARPDRIRCRTGAGEFSAVGRAAATIIGAATDADVFGPLRALVEADGAVVLMGVGLTRMTLLHLAEVEAGRRPFVRWTRRADGRAVRVCAGGCSEGFEQLAPALAPIERSVIVGTSPWRVFPASEAVYRAARAIAADPSLTSCSDLDCLECPDAVAGGPLS